MVGALGLGLGVLAGGAAGAIGGLLFGGGTKKEQTVAQAQEQQMATIIHPYGVYTPTYAPTIEQAIDYSVIIESPGAAITTKKEQTATPTFTITPTIAPAQEGGEMVATQGMGIDPTILVIGGAVLLGGYLLLKKKGGKKR